LKANGNNSEGKQPTVGVVNDERAAIAASMRISLVSFKRYGIAKEEANQQIKEFRRTV
jgi:hypothetical protein